MSEPTLSDADKARIERNRQRALLLRQSRLANHPYKKDNSVSRISDNKLIDTNGGFFLEENEQIDSTVIKINNPLPPIVSGKPKCEECEKEFDDSYLLTHFDQDACDECRKEEKYSFITKTEAKSSYLLKDCDLDKREPPLKFIRKKNPRNNTWGEMHLYLKCQVEKRALEVWGTEDQLEEEHEKRNENREKSKRKKFDAKVRELRRAVRSSTWIKKNDVHEHEYGPEVYSEEDDVYVKTCTSCGHSLSYEKIFLINSAFVFLIEKINSHGSFRRNYVFVETN